MTSPIKRSFSNVPSSPSKRALSSSTASPSKRARFLSLEQKKLEKISDSFASWTEYKGRHSNLLPKASRLSLPSCKTRLLLQQFAEHVLTELGTLDDEGILLLENELDKNQTLFVEFHYRQLKTVFKHLKMNAALRDLFADEYVIHPSLQKLLCVTLGLPLASTPNSRHVKLALLGTLFADLRQQPEFANCYAIAPLISHIHSHPDKVLAALINLMRSGKYEEQDALMLLKTRLSFIPAPCSKYLSLSHILSELTIGKLAQQIFSVSEAGPHQIFSFQDYVMSLISSQENPCYGNLFMRSFHQNLWQELLLSIIQYKTINDEMKLEMNLLFKPIAENKCVISKGCFFQALRFELLTYLGKLSTDLVTHPPVLDFILIFLANLQEQVFLTDATENERYFVERSTGEVLLSFKKCPPIFPRVLHETLQQLNSSDPKVKRACQLLTSMMESFAFEAAIKKVLKMLNNRPVKTIDDQIKFSLYQDGGEGHIFPFTLFGLPSSSYVLFKGQQSTPQSLLESLCDHLQSEQKTQPLLTLASDHLFLVTPHTFMDFWTHGSSACRLLIEDLIIKPARDLAQKVIMPGDFTDYIPLASHVLLPRLGHSSLQARTLVEKLSKLLSKKDKKKLQHHFWDRMQRIIPTLTDLKAILLLCEVNGPSEQQLQSIHSAIDQKFGSGVRAFRLASFLRKKLGILSINISEDRLEKAICIHTKMPFVCAFADLNYPVGNKENPAHQRLVVGYDFQSQNLNFFERNKEEFLYEDPISQIEICK